MNYLQWIATKQFKYTNKVVRLVTQREKMVKLMDSLLAAAEAISCRICEGTVKPEELAVLPALTDSINALTKYACLGD